jgi:hypothetical protein
MQLTGFMKILAAALLLALAFVSSAHAILRPRFPHRTHPPRSAAAEDFRVPR